MTIKEYFKRLPCPLIEIHLHDNNGVKDQHGHFGLGTVPFQEVADVLKELDLAPICTFEIAPKFHNYTPLESKLKAKESLKTWQRMMAE